MNSRLAHFTTFRLGGECRELVTATAVREVAEILRRWRAQGVAWRVMGGGSNLLVADGGIPEAVLRIVAEEAECRMEDGLLSVSAGTALDDLARFAAEGEWAGLGFAAGIPGTVGGGIVGNAGAFGASLGDRLERIEVLSPMGERRMLGREELSFGYRCSSLQTSGVVVLQAWFRVEKGDAVELVAKREEILAMRREKHPDWRVLPTAGSFFKNLPPGEAGERRRAAGYFLEQAGAKTMREGGAHVFEKHANIVIAEPGARAQDVARLTTRMAAAVKRTFGFDLEPEVRCWGAVENAGQSTGGPP